MMILFIATSVPTSIHLLLHFDVLVEALRLWCPSMLHCLIGWTAGSEQHVTGGACQALKLSFRRAVVSLLPHFVALSPAAHTVISEEKGQCFRVLGSGQGPSSCSLPILKNITKQICCCSRVGKAWGVDCQRCPYFGSGWPTLNHIPFLNHVHFKGYEMGWCNYMKVLCYYSRWCQTFVFVPIFGWPCWYNC